MKNMKVISFNKLVRDRIPQYLRQKGLVVKSRIANTREYRTLLREKLLEEVAELLRARGKEEMAGELADVLEVLEALAKTEGVTPARLVAKKQAKRKERGGFSKRVVLESVIE